MADRVGVSSCLRGCPTHVKTTSTCAFSYDCLMLWRAHMPDPYCIGKLCLVPLDPASPRVFTFPDFLAGFAVVVLAWTIADVRYRFRVATAPVPLFRITFAVVASVGTLTLFTDLWRSHAWWVPHGSLLTPAGWQVLLAGSFLLTLLSWGWFAFIHPPRYGSANAHRYAVELYKMVLKGNPVELAVIADELARSATALIRHATDGRVLQRQRIRQRFAPIRDTDRQKIAPREVTAYANDILLLIGDRRFSRVVVDASPGTALALFHAIAATKKYGVQIQAFARNLVSEAIANKNSFLFQEAEGYETGLLGFQKPLSHAVFSNHEMVSTIGTLFDPDFRERTNWDSTQWAAYLRAALITLRGYVDEATWNQSPVLSSVLSDLEHSHWDLHHLNGMSDVVWNHDVTDRLRVTLSFIRDSTELLDAQPFPLGFRLRSRDHLMRSSIFDDFAHAIFEVIFCAAAVRSPRDLCWQVQHNMVWSKLFNFRRLEGPAGRLIKFKVRRLLYNEISDMKRFPNFKGAKILSFCLNVMGLELRTENHSRDSQALQKAVLSWTKKNWIWLHSHNPRLAEASLVEGLSYDSEARQLVRTYPVDGLRREPSYVRLDLEHP